MNSQQAVVLVGPSGIGKTFIMKNLMSTGLFTFLRSTTTRTPRIGEDPLTSTDYEFMSEEDYMHVVESGGFITNRVIAGNKYGFRKGILDEIFKVGSIPLAAVHTSVIQEFQQNNPYGTRCIGLLPVNLEFLRYRMGEVRGDNQNEVEKRIQMAIEEIEFLENSVGRTICKERFIIGDDNIKGIIESITSPYFNHGPEGNYSNINI